MPTRCLPHVALLPVVFSSIVVGASALYPDELLASTSKEPIPAFMPQDDVNPLGYGCGAPPRLYVGPVAGAVLARHADAVAPTRFAGLDANNHTATGTGWNIGWQIWYILGDIKDAQHSLAVNVLYASMPSKVESTMGTPLAFGAQNATRTQAKYEKEIDYAVISVDMLYNYRVMKSRFCLMAAPSVGIVVRSEQRERLSLLGDDSSVRFTANEESQKQGVQFENDNRVAVLKGDIPERDALRLSLKGGISYELSMRKTIFVPYILYEYPLSSVNSESAWKASAFHVGVQLRLAL